MDNQGFQPLSYGSGSFDDQSMMVLQAGQHQSPTNPPLPPPMPQYSAPYNPPQITGPQLSLQAPLYASHQAPLSAPHSAQDIVSSQFRLLVHQLKAELRQARERVHLLEAQQEAQEQAAREQRQQRADREYARQQAAQAQRQQQTNQAYAEQAQHFQLLQNLYTQQDQASKQLVQAYVTQQHARELNHQNPTPEGHHRAPPLDKYSKPVTINSYELHALVRLHTDSNMQEEGTLDDVLRVFDTPPIPKLHYTDFPQQGVSLGLMDRLLTPELLHNVVRLLPIRSLFKFRLVNHLAANTINASTEWRSLMFHASSAIRGVMAIHADEGVTLQDLYNVLTAPGCALCGNLGTYINLLLLERVCFDCLVKSERYLPLHSMHALHSFALDLTDLNQVKCRMQVLGGRYGGNPEQVNAPCTVVDRESARQVGLARHGSEFLMQHEVYSRNMNRIKEAQIQLARARAQRDYTCRPHVEYVDPPFDDHDWNPLRFVAVVRAPWFNEATQRAEHGFACNLCIAADLSDWYYQPKFTNSSFLHHLKDAHGFFNEDN